MNKSREEKSWLSEEEIKWMKSRDMGFEGKSSGGCLKLREQGAEREKRCE